LGQVSVTWEQSLANEKGVSNSEGWRLLEDADSMPSDDMIIGNSLMTTMQCSQCNTVSGRRRGGAEGGQGRGERERMTGRGCGGNLDI
jgi:hypothetical protein